MRHGGSLEVTQFTRNCPHQIVSLKNACILNNSELSRISDWEGLSPYRQGSKERFGAGGNIVVISPATWFEGRDFRYRVLSPAPFKVQSASFSPSQWETVPCLLDPQISRTISDVRASLLLSKVGKGRDAPGMGLSLGKCCPHLYGECVAATTKNWWYYSCQVIFYSKFQVVAGTIPKSNNGKFNYQYNLLVKKRRGNWGYKINAEKNRSKDIKEKWKLYRSILGKYKYTSLELGVRSRPSPCCNAFFSGRLPCSGGTGEGRSLYR